MLAVVLAISHRQESPSEDREDERENAECKPIVSRRLRTENRIVGHTLGGSPPAASDVDSTSNQGVHYANSSRNQENVSEDLEICMHVLVAMGLRHLTSLLRHGAPMVSDMQHGRDRAVAWSSLVRFHATRTTRKPNTKKQHARRKP